MNKVLYIISTTILVWILLVFFAIYSFVQPILAESKKNISGINDELILTIKNYKSKWHYDIQDYKEVSYLPIYTKSWELYAEIVPDDYKSSRDFNIHSNELRSLLYIEDKGFLFRDLTFSIKWMMRAIYNIHFKWIKQWWSWITQQLVKNVILDDNESSLSRKYKELIVSYYIDNQFSKIDIINSYLNQISYWKNIYWIEKAWELYLWKEELRLEDTFFLNSMLKQPTFYYKNQDKLKERSKYYLGWYLKENWISDERIQLSMDYIDSLELNFRNHNNIYWANEYIRDKAKMEMEKNNLKEITLNYDISLVKEKEITDKIQEEEKRVCELYSVCDIWVVVLSKSWSINYKYWWNYSLSQVDSTSSKFELGSTLKPFIYWTFFDKYWNKSYLDNTRVCIWDYCPQNWDKSVSKSVTFNKAINFSYNLPIIHISKNYTNLNDLNDLFIKLWLYDSSSEEVNFSMVLWTKPSTLTHLSNSYYSLFEWNFKKISLFNENSIDEKILEEKSISYIKDTLKSNGLNYNYSIKTWTSSDFKDHYLIAINDNYVIWIWMWNKDWTKTKKDIYSITKWGGIFNILSEYF